MRKTVILLMFVTVISKLLGFARDIILSYFYGASEISDVYLISLTIPTVLIAILGKGVAVGFIPMYTRIESKDGNGKAIRYTNNVVNLVLVICSIIFIIGVVFTEPIVKLFASGFEGHTLKLAIIFTRITLVGVYFTGLINVYLAYLQIKEVFIVPALMGLPANLIAIGSIYVSSHTNIYMLAIGGLISIFSQFLLLIIYGYKSNYKYKLELDFKDTHIRKMAILALPAILGTSVAQINLLIDRTLASRIVEGGITALNLASTINVIIIGIFVLSINSVIYPKISKLSAENNIEKLKNVLFAGISAINVLVLPAAVGLMLFSEPIVVLLYGRGHFDSHAISMTSYALFFYSIGLIGLSHREILSNTFYSFQDTKTPMINAAIAMGLNIGLNLVLSQFMGIGGLALGSSISAIVCTLLLLMNLRKRIGNLGLKSLSISLMKIIIASLAMGGISKYIYGLLISNFSLAFSLMFSVCLGACVYFVLIYLLKIKEMNMIVFAVKRKLNLAKEVV
jgi:putative peptidoglycan lipid II flippase